MNPMRKILLIVIVSFASVTAHAEAWLCISDAVGGVKYEEGKWEGTVFMDEPRYIVRRGHEGSLQVQEFGKDGVTATCNEFNEESALHCEGIGTDFYFSSKQLTFLYVYYVGPQLPKKRWATNTPHIAVGVCSEI